MKEKNFISAVLYINNDKDKIEGFLENLNNILDQNFEKYEIICVNDGSTDGSADMIKSFAEKTSGPAISLINMSYYQGLEMSMNAGVELAIGDFVYEFDTINLDYPIDMVMSVYYQSLKGFDIVSASSEEAAPIKSRLFYKLYNKFSNNTYKLKTETFRILSRRAINRVQSMSKTVPYRKAIYANCGLKLYSFSYKPLLSSKHKTTSQLKQSRLDLAIDSLVLFTNITYKISVSMAVFMMLTVVLTAFYTIMIFLTKKPIEGWTTIMLFLSFAFFGVFALFSIVIKYLSILVNLVFKKEKYVIESIEKLSN